MTITVVVTDMWAGREQARAEADSPEAAVVAARTLWQDVQDAEPQGRYRPCVTTFLTDEGRTLLRTEGRPS